MSIDEKAARKEMREWFLETYTLPAEVGVPYNSDTGTFWFHENGPPYEPSEVLHDHFRDEYPEKIIQEVAEDLVSDGDFEWVMKDDY